MVSVMRDNEFALVVIYADCAVPSRGVSPFSHYFTDILLYDLVALAETYLSFNDELAVVAVYICIYICGVKATLHGLYLRFTVITKITGLVIGIKGVLSLTARIYKSHKGSA